MRYYTFISKDPTSRIVYLLFIRVARYICNTQECDAMYIFRHHLNVLVRLVIKVRVATLPETVRVQDRCETLYFVTVNYLVMQYNADDSIHTVDDYICSFKQNGLQCTDYVHQAAQS